ncbi:hypothetical protein DMB66_24340 [Actinoplanes sp. ATCC 53533]|uniref:diguanylate cyclase n=1 Tax=Actinoplanes sp. ATCC 53533 TaxID=1288362 RepID=UPI000F77BCC8|nr:diguanylate cyclase [Actinoplanes sp. ATCC 53533]RSM61648.1 hypothetical protein DMB66_24340 [Actinoplanes sp. ATCC 53533]
MTYVAANSTPSGAPRVPGVTVLDELGRGANAVTYRVRRDGRDWAMKVYARTPGGGRPALLVLRREAALLTWVDHPGLPRVHEVGEVDGRAYMIMDLVAGRPLGDVLAAGPLSVEAVVRLGRAVAEALAAVHRIGLVHRDVKPPNIMIEPGGHARLIDFGMAVRTDRETGDAAAGTFRYAAPEQTGMIKRRVDGRADLYALGAVLFECLAGTPPFVADDAGELLRMHAATPAPALAEHRPDAPAELCAIVATLLAKDPDDRYQSVPLLLAALGAVDGAPAGDDDTEAGRLPLAGRDPQWQALREAWQQVRSGAGGTVLVTGGPGAGKTRIAEELVTRALADGVPVLHARCAAGAAPLAALREAVEYHALHPAEPDRAARADQLRAVAVATGTATAVGRLSPLLAGPTAPGPAAAGPTAPGPAAPGPAAPGPTAAGPTASDRATQDPTTAGLAASDRAAPGLAASDRAAAGPAGWDEPAWPDALGQGIAGFLAGLARDAGGALLCLDDVDAADAASLTVLRQLVGQLDACPLLVLGTATGDGSAPAPVRAVFGDSQAVTLGPLDPAAVAALVTACVRGLPADDELVQRLVARGGVSPFEVVEYVRAVVDAGLLAPAWGSWALDTEGLDDVPLLGDVYELMLSRLDGLAPATRRLLTVAAAIGPAFAPDLAARANRMAAAAVDAAPEPTADEALAEALDEALDEALACRVVEHRGDRLAFVHDGIRTALLAGLDDDRRRALHQSLAEALDQEPSDDPEHVHALARHYLLGEVERTPDRLAVACLAAGRLALASHAPAEAVECLAAVERLAGREAWLVAHEVDELLGAAYYQAGHLGDAQRVLSRALAGVPTRLDRARLLSRIAEIQQAMGDIAASLATARRALAELGRPLPANPLMLVVSTLLSFVAGLCVERFRIGFGTAAPRRRAGYRLRTRLYNTSAVSAILMMDPLNTVMLTLRSLYPATRLGICAEYARARIDMASLLRSTGLPWRRSAALARHAASMVGERGAVEHVAWLERSVPQVLGQGDIRRLVADTLDRAHLLDTSTYLKMLEGGLFLLLDAGYTDEAETLRADGARRVAEDDLAEHSVVVWGIAAAAARGNVAEADARWQQTEEHPPAFTNPGDLQTRLHASIRLAVEQRDFAELDRAAGEFAAMGMKPAVMPLYRRAIFAAIAYGRIEACLAAPPERRPAALAAVDLAVRHLRRGASGGRTLTAHHLVAAAYTRHLRGDHEGALAALAAADHRLRAADAPQVTYEAVRLRARALAALGRHEDAAAHAATALAVAERQRWPHRARWIRTEFDLGGSQTGTIRDASSGSTGSFSSDRQRLAAVEQLSLVASSILDPAELTRVALDEIIKLLGADRAYLFLIDGTDHLVPHQGRDAAGTDLTTPTGYGSTLVERVRHSREALVVTGTEEGIALGSQSVLAHGLRSILVAPLLFDGRLLGVVYLDSRVAKGMFTAADAGVLMTLTTHVAAALETARAAELAVAVRSARRERDIAETMRDAVTHLSGTLDPADVLRRLHATLRRALPAGRSWLAVLDDGKLQVWDDHDEHHDAALAGPDAEPDLARLLTAAEPVTGAAGVAPPAPFGPAAGNPWVAIPLRLRAESVGLAVLTCPDPAGYSAGQIEIGTALAGQGMTAYENARLFAQVERLATTDGLTGLFNRRHFFELALRELALSRRRSGPLTVVMLDIDHFKQINDRHGHPVGDQVIATVAQRLAATVRGTDVLGRYGGEEFAVLLPDTGDDGSSILAERLRAVIGDRPIETDTGPLTVTVSVGVASRDTDMSVAELLGRADRALYQAKEGGRNRVVVSA